MSNFHPLEAVGHGSETKLLVGFLVFIFLFEPTAKHSQTFINKAQGRQLVTNNNPITYNL